MDTLVGKGAPAFGVATGTKSMELGVGFFIGLLAGAIVAVIMATILSVSRKAVKKGHTSRHAAAATRTSQKPQTGTAPAAQARAPVPKRSATTMIVEEVDARDVQFGRSVQEVRDLILRLADVISCADTASDQAAKAFNTAKDAIDGLDMTGDHDDDLIEAQRILVHEIDRIIRSNAILHSELDKAHRGIEEQRLQIEDLRVQARIDGLTRIPNRAAFDERLKEYQSLLERTKLAFTLLLVDIDHFKQVNDRHGHLNGDRILRGVAAKIADSVRTNDFTARYGGEEFAVIFPGAALDEAAAVSERIRADIEKTNFRLDDKNIKVTVSGGVAQCRQGMGRDALVKAADDALYHAKETGRNRIVAAKAD